ncbi:MAG: calcium-binding protein, partial [Burkholderiales bacterium]
MGGAGNDELRGFNDRNDVIHGGAGNDRLLGLSGDDVLDGGAGNETLEGGAGADTYRFDLGGGQDVIIEGYDTAQDVLELAPGVTPDDVTVRWTTLGDMAVTLADGSRVTVRGQANPWSDEVGIEQVRFADGTTWDRAALAALALAAPAGDDAIVGGYEDDTLEGGAGNDRFQNLGGYDTYRFGVGDGQDMVEATYGSVLFKPGIGQNDVDFTRDGNDLIATVSASGDSVRVKNWLSNWQRIDHFEFDNGAQLSVNDIQSLLNVSDDAEILYGAPGDDTLTGTEKDSIIYGREGNDILTGGEGSDNVYGEIGNDVLHGDQGDDTLDGGVGNDILDGGAGRDWLYGGEGNNTYAVASGMGLDNAMGAALAVANDTVVFAPGIRPEDVSVQLGDASGWWDQQAGDAGYYDLVIGIGGNDALVLRTQNGDDLGRGAIQHFHFDDGTQWSLADLMAQADGGKMGWQQRNQGDARSILGSQADDQIYDYTGESITVQARGNNDNVQLQAGNDIVSAGSGNDTVYSGQGDDLIAGEAGDDRIDAGEGDDVLVFNYGDGRDELTAGEGLDTLSFGADVTPDMLSVALDRDGRVMLLVDGGAGGALILPNTSVDNLLGDLERLQFIDADGKTRVFDLVGWLRANSAALFGATAEAPLAFNGAFELTGSAAPAGGLEAVAYAQAGDLFAPANVAHNTPTEGDDVLYGTPTGDTLDAGAGNDIALGLAGDDTLFGGEGNDLIVGGDGDDLLEGGAGDDVVRGGWGQDQLAGGAGRDELHGEW